MTKHILLPILALGLCWGATTAQAAVVITLPTPSTAGSIAITQDIDFTITTAGTIRAVLFDELVSAADADTTGLTSFDPGFLAYKLNSVLGTLSLASGVGLYDNYRLNIGAATPQDGVLFLPGAPAVAVGDVFTLVTATYTIPAGTSVTTFNPQAAGTFTGNASVITSGVTSLSAPTSVAGAVPEPSASLLGLVALAGMAFRRRR
jgi:hypothetical protein